MQAVVATKAQFEVTDHFELAGRGGFVIGHICSGVFRIRMQVRTAHEPGFFTISGIEFLDDVTERKVWNALMFRECPTLEFVKPAFPIGAVLLVEEDAS